VEIYHTKDKTTGQIHLQSFSVTDLIVSYDHCPATVVNLARFVSVCNESKDPCNIFLFRRWHQRWI